MNHIYKKYTLQQILQKKELLIEIITIYKLKEKVNDDKNGKKKKIKLFWIMEGSSNILEEENVADNIGKYLQRSDFLERNLSSIDRIMQLYFNSNRRNKAVDK